MSASWSPSPLIPPFRFGTVEPEVYRGAYPKQRNLRYLKRLKLKTILSLIPDAPDEVFQEFCAQQGIRSIHLPVDKVKDNVPLTYNRAVEAVQVIIDQENLPIYIHCLDGASVTGLVVCCLRKLQTWNISSAMGEFLRYLRGGVISSEESVFVEKFCSEIEISKPIPPWLWEGQITFKKHPTLKLNFTIPPAAAAATALTAMNGTDTSASSPILSASSQGTVAVFQNQQGDGNGSNNMSHGGGNNNVSIALNGGDSRSNSALSVSSSTGNTTSLNSSGLGTGSPGSRSNLTGSATSTGTPLLTSTTNLINHATRSSVNKGGNALLRDRPNNGGGSGVNKNTIRTDLSGSPTTTTTGYGSSRTTSIATPTTAALGRNKRGMVGSPSVLGQQQQDQTPAEALSTVSGLGVRLGNLVSSSTSTSASSAGSGAGGAYSGGGSLAAGAGNVDSSAVSHVISVIHKQNGEALSGGDGDMSSSSRDGSSPSAGHRGDDNSNSGGGADVSTPVTQDRTTNNPPTIMKNSPVATPVPVAAQEVVDEYYEVSMTLKALALEGADF